MKISNMILVSSIVAQLSSSVANADICYGNNTGLKFDDPSYLRLDPVGNGRIKFNLCESDHPDSCIPIGDQAGYPAALLGAAIPPTLRRAEQMSNLGKNLFAASLLLGGAGVFRAATASATVRITAMNQGIVSGVAKEAFKQALFKGGPASVASGFTLPFALFSGMSEQFNMAMVEIYADAESIASNPKNARRCTYVPVPTNLLALGLQKNLGLPLGFPEQAATQQDKEIREAPPAASEPNSGVVTPTKL